MRVKEKVNDTFSSPTTTHPLLLSLFNEHNGTEVIKPHRSSIEYWIEYEVESA